MTNIIHLDDRRAVDDRTRYQDALDPFIGLAADQATLDWVTTRLHELTLLVEARIGRPVEDLDD